MRFLHTSDWHLGRSFFGASLLEDQAHILDRLLALIAESRLDAVLVAGDVYDRSAPPADAVRLLDDTLTRIVLGCGVPVVLIAGNHDSGDRLSFGSRLLTERGLHVAGNEPCVVRLGDADGEVEIVAIPFAEPAAAAERCARPEIADHDAALRAEILRLSSPAKRRVAVAHAFVSGGQVSESERPLVMGNAALVGADCFDGFSYAALGHLHRPQKAGREEVRYSGSLLKYSFDEASHRKSVSIVEIDATGACSIEHVELGARRDVRVLEGPLDELVAGAAGNGSREDYVLARLTDRGAILDAMGKVRAAYPNCLHVQRNEYFAARAEDGNGTRADLRKQTHAQMFDAFFRDVTGEEPDEAERLAFEDALAVARREEEAG